MSIQNFSRKKFYSPVSLKIHGIWNKKIYKICFFVNQTSFELENVFIFPWGTSDAINNVVIDFHEIFLQKTFWSPKIY